MSKKDQILQLRSEGKSYNEIVKIVGCSKGNVSYHCGEGQKEKTTNRTKKRRNGHPYIRKTENFLCIRKINSINIPVSTNSHLLRRKLERFINRNQRVYTVPNFTIQDVINKVGESPKCYLTGEHIDINKPRTYNFDHIIPASRGGDNTLDNLGICTKQVNSAKSDMTPDEFINLCKKVLIHNGYNITK